MIRKYNFIFSQAAFDRFPETSVQFKFHFHGHLPSACFKNLINQDLQEMKFKFALELLVLMTRQEIEVTSFYLPDGSPWPLIHFQ